VIRALVGTYYVLSIGDKEGRKEGKRKKERKKTMKILSTKHCKN
jgi:hypothetical protein